MRSRNSAGMIVLGVHTAGSVCEAALWEGASGDGALIAERSEPMVQGHDARLAPVVALLMADAGLAMDRIDRIAVIAGPGSFTGVRVGVAFARGLGLALGRPATGVTSLEAVCLEARGEAGARMLCALSAKRRPPERTWWAQIVVDGVGEGEPVEADEAGLRAMLAGTPVFAGEGLADIDPDRPVAAAQPSARAAARIVARRAPAALVSPVPIYVREPDATPMTRTIQAPPAQGA